MRVPLHISIAVLMLATAGVCQSKEKPPRPQNRPMWQGGQHHGGPPPHGRGPGGGPGSPLFEELAKMPAADREKALQANPHFQRMPPERQQQVRQNLERYANMPPEQQQVMRERADIFNRLPPESRQRLREVFPQWRKLSEDRRTAMLEEFRGLASKSPADREKRFADPEFQKTFSPDEQRLLKNTSELLNTRPQ